MNIATALNRKYLEYTSVMLTSVCENNRQESVRVFLLHHELTDEDVRLLEISLEAYDIEIVPLKVERKKFTDRFPRTAEWSIEMYYRLMLFDLLPDDVERLLYLDVDIIVNMSLHEFYYTDFEGKELVVCENAGGYINYKERMGQKQLEMFDPLFKQGFQYFNSGVMLMNVEKLRVGYNFKRYMDCIKKWNYEMGAPDQDILNYEHWDQLIYADAHKYNYFSRIAHENGIDYENGKKVLGIIHYTDEKPWNTKNYHYPIEKIWWDYAKKTMFYHELLEQFMEQTMADATIEEWIRSMMGQLDELEAKLGQSLELNKKIMSLVR